MAGRKEFTFQSWRDKTQIAYLCKMIYNLILLSEALHYIIESGIEIVRAYLHKTVRYQITYGECHGLNREGEELWQWRGIWRQHIRR